MTARTPDKLTSVSRIGARLIVAGFSSGLAACLPLKDLDTYSAGSPPAPPPITVDDASAPPPVDVPPEIIVGPLQPDASASPADAGPALDAAPDGGSCDGPGEAVGPDGQGCYRLVAIAASWIAAQAECVDWGGHLVTVASEAEDDYLATRSDGDDIWIGLNDGAVEGQMVWVNGEPIVIDEPWAANQPDDFQNEDCVEKRGQDGLWNDRACGAPHVYICER